MSLFRERTWSVIGWFRVGEIDAVHAMHAEAHGSTALPLHEFERILQQGRVVATVARDAESKILGYMLHRRMQRGLIRILDLAVRADSRRRGIATGLYHDMCIRSCHDAKGVISALVSERHTHAHLFFRSLGFRADCVRRGCFTASGDDGYEFERSYGVVTS